MVRGEEAVGTPPMRVAVPFINPMLREKPIYQFSGEVWWRNVVVAEIADRTTPL